MSLFAITYICMYVILYTNTPGTRSIYCSSFHMDAVAQLISFNTYYVGSYFLFLLSYCRYPIDYLHPLYVNNKCGSKTNKKHHVYTVYTYENVSKQ